jgi:hypothetical protein
MFPLERVWVQITFRRLSAGGSCTPGISRAQQEGRRSDHEVVSPPEVLFINIVFTARKHFLLSGIPEDHPGSYIIYAAITLSARQTLSSQRKAYE